MPITVRAPRSPTLVVFLALVVGCGGDASPAPATLDDVVEWEGALVLEETESAVVAVPRLSPDPLGGFIVAATRDAAGRLVVLTHERKLSVWSPGGDSLLAVRDAPSRASSVAPFGEGIALAVVPPDVPEPPVLYLYGEDGAPDTALVRPGLTEATEPAFVIVVGAAVEGSGTTRVVTVPTMDTLWVVEEAPPHTVRAVPILSRLMAGIGPPADPFVDRPGFFEWLQSSWFVRAAYPGPGGGWLVSLRHDDGEGRRWALARLDGAGTLEWELADVARLVTVDTDGRLVFDDPESLFPNRFRLARLR